MATDTTILTAAPPPFDDPDSDADIIIGSAEGVEFRTHKLLLAWGSAVFKGMFSIPQPSPGTDGPETLKPEETRDGIPIVFMYNDRNGVCGKDVVEYILSSCHPTCLRSGMPSLSVELVGPVLDVSARYTFEWVTKSVLRNSDFLQTNPFVLFAYACRNQLAEEAALAANAALRFCIADFPSEPALRLISGYEYHNLLQCHIRCAKAASALARLESGESGFRLRNWLKNILPQVHSPCCDESRVDSWNHKLNLPMSKTSRFKCSTTTWLIDYLEATATQLAITPYFPSVGDQKRLEQALTTASSCSTCATNVMSITRTFIPRLQREIEEACKEIITETVFLDIALGSPTL
ncbi:hypothetical protein R3P38DRAFT_832188 [Favolaschia claudopus]|uniref:BTB domain-containing protein n=1 Tax=Favolaschia claudopus TaxID=2862362 RepID=A0AAV9Z1F6_9AGAR